MEVVVHDGVIREKPTTPEEARKFIQGLSFQLFVFELKLLRWFVRLVRLTTYRLQDTPKAMLQQLDLCLLQM
jgi:uncharacterized membrane protein